MRITDLNIHNLRNISSSKFKLNEQANLFFGPNGSGKTTLLESIYLLSTGHSFRTREISPLVSHGEQSFTIFARSSIGETISIKKSLSGPTQVRLNTQPCNSSSELAKFLPCQVFYQDIFQIIDAGPATRRSLLDWGLFHVEHSYLTTWKAYNLVLKQRNALIRQKAARQYFIPWDKQLVTLAENLNSLREEYFKNWKLKFQELLPSLTDLQCNIEYYKGWDRKNSGKNLEEILNEQFTQDQHRQYTHSGAHQADISFDLSTKKAKLLLSRGQQKIVLIALKLSQAQLIQKECIYLLDDIAAELDSEHLTRLLIYLQNIKGQLFLTAMDEKTLSFSKYLNLISYKLG